MPRFEIYNPNNALGVRDDVRLMDLPQSARSFLAGEIRAGIERAGDTSPVENLEWSTLRQYDGLVDVGAALDRWAVSASFDPRRVSVPQAAWALRRADGAQAVLMATMVQDDMSPCRFGWDMKAFTWDGDAACWAQGNQGVLWNFKDASEAYGAIKWPYGFDISNTEVARIPSRFAEEELNVRAAPEMPERAMRVFDAPTLEDEFEAMKRIDWAARDNPRYPNLFGVMDRLGKDCTLPISAVAGRYDVLMSNLADGRVACSIADAQTGQLRSWAAQEAGGDVAAAAKDVYRQVYENNAREFSGIANPADPEHPHKSFEDAARAHARRTERSSLRRAVPQAKAPERAPMTVAADIGRTGRSAQARTAPARTAPQPGPVKRP